MVIGLTGGIASGKSTVASMLKNKGAATIDADEISHRMLKKGNPGYSSVIEHFGPGIISEKGEIDRSLLGDIIFNNPVEKKKLEDILHPLIISEINRKIEEYKKENRIIVVDAPLLFEAELTGLFDQILVVYCDKENQIKRLIKRDGISSQKARNMIDSQLSLEKKRRLADVVIENRGYIKDLKEQVADYWREINEDKTNCPDST